MRPGILGMAVGLLLAVGGGQAEGATTFGADLSTSSSITIGVDPYTTVTRSIPAGKGAAGGATAPVDGVVVRWRVRSKANSSPTPGQSWEARFRLAHGNQSVGASAPVQVADADGTQVFDTRLPVHAGDALGLDTPGGEGFVALEDGAMSFYSPPLGVSETRNPVNDGSYYLNVNADIEADADGDGYGDETQDMCPSDASTHGACPDKTSPETTITRHPKAKSTSKSAQFAFSSSEAGSTFECALDGSAFAVCTSPAIKTLGVGPHVFQVRAIDSSGNVDQSPAVATWKVTKKKKKHHKHHHHGHGHG
jgi:hypothetical protein